MMIGNGGVNWGDIIYQLVSFFILLLIPTGIIMVILWFKRKNSRLQRIEEKLDRLLNQMDSKG